MKKIIKVGLLVFQVSTKWSENTLISFRFEAKQSEKLLIHFTLKQNEKIGSKTKRNEKLLETKQSKNMVY